MILAEAQTQICVCCNHLRNRILTPFSSASLYSTLHPHRQRIGLKVVLCSAGETNSLPGASTADILSQPVACYLVPFDFLPSDRQLSAQALEGSFAKTRESLVQFLLVLLLRCRDLICDAATAARGIRCCHCLVRYKAHISVLVVVHVDLDGSL